MTAEGVSKAIPFLVEGMDEARELVRGLSSVEILPMYLSDAPQGAVDSDLLLKTSA